MNSKKTHKIFVHDNSISSLIWSWGAPHNADVSQGLHQPAELVQLSSPSTKELETGAESFAAKPIHFSAPLKPQGLNISKFSSQTSHIIRC